MRVLLLNSTIVNSNCGVFQYGVRLYNILKSSTTITYEYREVSNFQDYSKCLIPGYNAIIYNYSNSTMPWLNEYSIQSKSINIGILHESPTDIFDITLAIDTDNPETLTSYNIPRPIYENIDDLLAKSESSTPQTVSEFISAGQESIQEIPVFGSFGYGFGFEGFDKVVKIVNDNYDTALIKLVVECVSFDPVAIKNMAILVRLCNMQITKPGIKLMITNDRFSNEDILRFLKSNTANIFMYDELKDSKYIANVIDYALSVKKPLVISNSHMFRHIYDDSICVYKTPIQFCINNSVQYCQQYLDKYSNSNLINVVDSVILNGKKKEITLQIKSNSQACQDLFVLAMLDNKQNGYFLEIGSNHPIIANNSYLLESQYNWTGILVEYDEQFEPLYDQIRPSAGYIINDARAIDYASMLDLQFGINGITQLDYLQIDLEVDNKSTLDVLELLDKTVFDKYKFATITFETDIYRGDFFNTRALSREIFMRRGYVLLFPDVKVLCEDGYKPFEDWYVQPDLVNTELIKKLKTESSLTSKEIETLIAPLLSGRLI